MNGLLVGITHVDVQGTIAIVSTSVLIVGFIGWLNNRLYDPLLVKSNRNTVRNLNILMQI